MSGPGRSRRTDLLRLLGAYSAGAVLMGVVNVLALAYLEGRYPGVATAYLRTCVASLLAAVQEPVTSKLVPALAMLALVGTPAGGRWLRRHRWRLAALGGLTVGTIEFGSKLIEGYEMAFGLFPPVLLHVSTGLIVGVAVFRAAGRDRSLIDAHVVVLALGLAVLVHVGWNRYVGFWLAGAGATPC